MYIPSQSLTLDTTSLQLEFRRIAEAFEQGSDRLKLITTAAAPAKATEGEVRVADGTNWDPGRGAGTYIYRNGLWQLIEAGSNKDIRSMEFFLGE